MGSGYVSGEDGGDGTMPGSTVSVSLVGLAVYFSWGLLFLSLIAILFFLACTPCQRSVKEGPRRIKSTFPFSTTAPRCWNANMDIFFLWISSNWIVKSTKMARASRAWSHLVNWLYILNSCDDQVYHFSIWCCGCSKPRKVPHMSLDLVDIQYNLR